MTFELVRKFHELEPKTAEKITKNVSHGSCCSKGSQTESVLVDSSAT